MEFETQGVHDGGDEGIAASREKIDVVRRAIDAFNDRDLDAAMQDCDPEVEIDWSRSRGVEAGVYRGYDACRSFWSTLIDTFDRITVAADEFIASGDHVVVPNRARVWGRDGIEVAARSVAVVTLRHGRIVAWSLYQERAEALEAVGLRTSTRRHAQLTARDTGPAMSGDQIVRKPLRARGGSSRTLDERLALRFPRLGAANARLLAKLPPGSRLREAALSRSVGLALQAYNRRDLDAAVVATHPEFEYHPGREWVEAGLVEPCYRGLEGYRRYVATVDEVWGGENYLKPVELIDLGDRIVMLANGTMRAQASGVPLTEAFALVSTLQDGRSIHLQEYYDHAEALEAVGLRD